MTTLDALRALLARRILVLDGAMGTMLQRHGFTEADFRGDRFADWPQPARGQQRPARASRSPTPSAPSTRAYLEAGADVVDDQHVQRPGRLPGRLRDGRPRLRDERRRRPAGARGRRRRDQRPTTGRASSPGSIGPMNRTLSLSPDVDDPGYRAVTFDAGARRLRRADPRPRRRRRGRAPRRDHLRHAQREGRRRRPSRARRETGAGLPVMRLRHHRGPERADARRGRPSRRSGISLAHAPEPAAVGLNCALGSAQMRPFIEELARRRAGPDEPLPERRAAQRTRRLRRGPGLHGRAGSRELRRGGPRQHRRRVLRDDARPHPRHRRGRRRARAARAARGRRSTLRLAGLEPSPSGPTRTSSTSASGRT